MRSFGVIGHHGSGDAVPREESDTVYSFDLSRPLELNLRKGGRHFLLREVQGYFYPLGEMLKRLDGPIFLAVPDGMLGPALEQLEEAVPPGVPGLTPAAYPLALVDRHIPQDKIVALRHRHPHVEIMSCDFSSQNLQEGSAFDYCLSRAVETLPEMSVGSRGL
jgi:hypothetical protein